MKETAARKIPLGSGLVLLAKSDLFFLKAFQCWPLTATASAGTRKKIIEMLSLHKSVQIVVSPNRDNIKLYLQKVTDEISDNFMWLVHELEQKQIECPKVLIYVRDYQRCSEI